MERGDLWPQPGESALQAVIRLFGAIGSLPNWQFRMGFIVVAVLALWPAIIAAIGARHLRTPPTDEHPMIGIVALYGLPLLLTMLIVRGALVGSESWLLLMGLGGVVVLGAVVALSASAIEVAAEAWFVAPEPGDPTAPPRRASAIGVAVVLALAGAQWLLARPPVKGVEWALKAPSEAGDTLFDETIPKWNMARLVWDRQARDASGAEALLNVKRAAQLVTEATALDPAVGAALDRLARGSRDLNIAGRKWYRMVSEVNQAIRKAGLPYYLDPAVFLFKRDGVRRHFRVRSFRVTRVNRYDVEGDAFATLHVERIDGQRGGSRLLGFSRDLQPFAIVLPSQIKEFDDTLKAGAAESPPTCAEVHRLTAAGGLYRCGQVLAKLLEAHPEGLSDMVVALTDRHELQHQVDGPLLPIASEVHRRLRGSSDTFKERVNRELSAYTAEFTTEDADPRLALIHILPFALNGNGQDIYHVALMILGQMSGLDPYLPDSREADVANLVEAFETLVALPEEELRERAADAWASFYGRSLAAARVHATQ